jgi:hypothetical protein
MGHSFCPMPTVDTMARLHCAPLLFRPLRALKLTMALAVMLPLTLTMSGCVSLYQPAAGQPTATLVIDSNKPGILQAFQNEACTPADAGSRISFLHPSEGDALRGTAKPVEAGKPLILSMQMNTPQDGQMVSCALTGRFTPAADRVYILFFRYNPTTHACTLNLMRRSSLGSTEAEPDFTLLPARCPNRVNG